MHTTKGLNRLFPSLPSALTLVRETPFRIQPQYPACLFPHAPALKKKQKKHVVPLGCVAALCCSRSKRSRARGSSIMCQLKSQVAHLSSYNFFFNCQNKWAALEQLGKTWDGYRGSASPSANSLSTVTAQLFRINYPPC